MIQNFEERFLAVVESDELQFDRLIVEVAKLDPTKELVGSDLRGVDFSDADLRGWNFSGCNLVGCNLSHAKIDGSTKFDGAIFLEREESQSVSLRSELSSISERFGNMSAKLPAGDLILNVPVKTFRFLVWRTAETACRIGWSLVSFKQQSDGVSIQFRSESRNLDIDSLNTYPLSVVNHALTAMGGKVAKLEYRPKTSVVLFLPLSPTL